LQQRLPPRNAAVSFCTGGYMSDKPTRYFTPSQEARLLNLKPAAQTVMLQIIAILQHSETTGDLIGDDFIDLIDALIAEARERREYYREFLPTD
jgi:hypothetical protein